MQTSPTVDLVQLENFLFRARFGGELPDWIMEEAEPIGLGRGPSPEQLLTAAVAYCLSSSLFFALRKFRNDQILLSVHAEAALGRNEQGRLRVLEIRNEITLNKAASDYQHLDRALSQFEEFCTVSQSVRQGLPVHVLIKDGDGTVLKSD